MAKYTGPKKKLERREETDLGLKSPARSHEDKCRANSLPGMHGKNRPRPGTYLQQLRAKQRIRRTYNVLERQFRNCYKKAAGKKGSTAENLMQILEQRLDNVVYRMGFAATRAEARQLVNHKAILVNGHCVNIPSYQVQAGDKVDVRERSKKQLRIQAALAMTQNLPACEWVSVDATAMSGTFNNIPTLTDLPTLLNPQLVVELYSK